MLLLVVAALVGVFGVVFVESGRLGSGGVHGGERQSLALNPREEPLFRSQSAATPTATTVPAVSAHSHPCMKKSDVVVVVDDSPCFGVAEGTQGLQIADPTSVEDVLAAAREALAATDIAGSERNHVDLVEPSLDRASGVHGGGQLQSTETFPASMIATELCCDFSATDVDSRGLRGHDSTEAHQAHKEGTFDNRTIVVIRTHGSVGSELFRYYAKSLPYTHVWCVYDATRGRSESSLAQLRALAADFANFHVFETSDDAAKRFFPKVTWPWHPDFTPGRPYVPPIGYYMHSPSLLLLLDHLAHGNWRHKVSSNSTSRPTEQRGHSHNPVGGCTPPVSGAGGCTIASSGLSLPEYLWVFEDDAFFIGNVAAFIDHFEPAREDYIGRFHHLTQDFLDRWTHWKQRTFDPATTPGWGPEPPSNAAQSRGEAHANSMHLPIAFTSKAPKGAADIVEKSEHVERLSLRLLLHVEEEMRRDRLLYGEIYESTLCFANSATPSQASQSKWTCRMRQLQNAEFEAADPAHYSFYHHEAEPDFEKDVLDRRLRNRWVHAVKWIKDDHQFEKALRAMWWTNDKAAL